MSTPLKIALAGNPNAGKSSLFNVLTGMRQKVGNFPGVTVDRKVGFFTLGNGKEVRLVDLPGLYSLYPQSDDEAIAVEVLTHRDHPDHPDLVMVVADSTNLKRSLLLCTQIMDLGLPTLLALNMADILEKEGVKLNVAKLSQRLGIPVISVSALQKTGIPELQRLLTEGIQPASKPFFQIPPAFYTMLDDLKKEAMLISRYQAFQVFLAPDQFAPHYREIVNRMRNRLQVENHAELIANEMAVRYDRISDLLEEISVAVNSRLARISDSLDRILLHPVLGYLIFAGVLFLVFQALFSLAVYPMDWIEMGFGSAGEWMEAQLPDHFLSRLWVNGIWAGLGGIVVFVPQIALLFMFIAILEGSGYMSRVVFLMDRIMRPFGFSGKSVIPLIGGMACAVPSIMMARTIPNRVERLITIMVVPLMSCSARIPVYVLLISLFVPDQAVLGIFNLQGVVMTGMYFLGFLMALLVAWVIKQFLVSDTRGLFISELPIYRFPPWKTVLLTMWQKSRTFVWEAGKVIMVISVILWLMASYGPGDSLQQVETQYASALEYAQTPSERDSIEVLIASEKLKASYAGKLGQVIEPAIRPLGFDWKIGIALISSFAAREVFVGTMATIYSAGKGADEDEEGKYKTIRERMAAEVYPDTGQKVYTPAVGISLLLFYAFAMQCMSTLAVVRRETGSWKMTAYMLLYMTALAYVSSLMAYQLLA